MEAEVADGGTSRKSPGSFFKSSLKASPVMPRRLVFRVLRGDEPALYRPTAGIFAKNPFARYDVTYFITNGSSPDLRSQFVATTANFDYAVAWAGVLFPMVAVDVETASAYDQVNVIDPVTEARGVTAQRFSTHSQELLFVSNQPYENLPAIPPEAYVFVKRTIQIGEPSMCLHNETVTPFPPPNHLLQSIELIPVVIPLDRQYGLIATYSSTDEPVGAPKMFALKCRTGGHASSEHYDVAQAEFCANRVYQVLGIRAPQCALYPVKVRFTHPLHENDNRMVARHLLVSEIDLSLKSFKAAHAQHVAGLESASFMALARDLTDGYLIDVLLDNLRFADHGNSAVTADDCSVLMSTDGRALRMHNARCLGYADNLAFSHNWNTDHGQTRLSFLQLSKAWRHLFGTVGIDSEPKFKNFLRQQLQLLNTAGLHTRVNEVLLNQPAALRQAVRARLERITNTVNAFD
jgi:hypothetical protein